MATAEQNGINEDGGASRRKRMTIFRAQEGAALTPERMAFEGVDETVMGAFGRMVAAGSAEGLGEKTVVLFSEPGDSGMSLVYAWFKSGNVLPKHSHNADCLYYVLGGELRMGTQILRKGDGIFIPADQGYTYDVGPDGVEVLEFRNATKFNIVFKSNEAAHWDRMVDAVRRNAPAWADENTPPSDRK